MSNEEIIKLAMNEAEIAVNEGNMPFGCVVVDGSGEIVTKEHDRVREKIDPTAHGEVNAIRTLCQQLNTLSLNDYIFYTTSEPCPACMAAMIKAKVRKVYYGAKTEATSSLPIPAEILASYATKHHIEVVGGILEKECLEQRSKLSL